MKPKLSSNASNDGNPAGSASWRHLVIDIDSFLGADLLTGARLPYDTKNGNIFGAFFIILVI
jgi:hypothetical protein